jgi:hypothetical protein
VRHARELRIDRRLPDRRNQIARLACRRPRRLQLAIHSLVAGLGDFGRVEPTSSVTSTVPGAFQSADRGGHQTIETVRVSYKFTP